MDIFEVLKAAADPKKAEPMSAYMRNQFSFLGIPTGERRRLSRGFFEALNKTSVDWGFVFKCWQKPQREFQYLALDYLSKLQALLTASHIPKLQELAQAKAWWDTIDRLALIVGGIALRCPQVNEILRQWSREENFWLRRIALIHQLNRKEKTNTRLLEELIVNNLNQKEFFINKAIGWSLRNYSKTNPHWVQDFLKKYKKRMASLSIKEASKYL